VMTFSKFHEHSSPIFKHLNIVKLPALSFLILRSLCINFAIDGYNLCLVLPSLKSIKDITIIQEVLRIYSLLYLQ